MEVLWELAWNQRCRFYRGRAGGLRPGYISLEMLQEVLGDVRMDKGLIKPDSKVHPKAPGMKYRHYAPKADLELWRAPQRK